MNKLYDRKRLGKGKGPDKAEKSGGFTLIELMIVIAIIAILVALAVPAYKDYTIRAKITECINGAAVAKIQVSEHRQSLGAWPASAIHAGIETPSGSSFYCTGFSDYQASTGSFVIDVDVAVIDASLGTIAPVLTPTELANFSINWTCTAGATAPGNWRYLPSLCRNT